MIEIRVGTMEGRILKLLQKEYPITIKEMAEKLGVSMQRIKMELIKLEKKGIVDFDVLPDKTYVRMIRFDIRFIGQRNQYKFIKRKKSKMEKRDENNEMMYA